ncbi:MAG: hypothetical protein JEY96_12760 [Bacteroidales bacterium]|nr:hypothetical protein [Bacteroidales bacterium]
MSSYYSLKYNKNNATIEWLLEPTNHKNFRVIENETFFIFCEGNIFNYNLIDTSDQIKLTNELKNNINYLEGDFSLFVYDKRDKSLIITNDLTASKKIFFYNSLEYLQFSNSIYLCIPQNWTLNKSGLAQYLANGFTFSGNTLIEEISNLQYATLLKVAHYSLSKDQYWKYTIKSVDKRPSVADYKKFDQLFTAAIKKRIKGQDIISLSGGFESTSIALKLSQSKPYLESFSYYGELSDMFDKKAVIQQNKHLKISNHFFKIKRKKSKSFFLLNSLLGMGVSNICRELEVIIELKKTYKEYNIFFGEETFGINKNKKNITDNLRLLNGEKLSKHYKKYINTKIIDQISSLLNNDILSHINNNKSEEKNKIDELYYEIQTTNKFTNWRYFFWEHFFSASNPLLDNSLIQFTSKLSPLQRDDKKFFVDYNHFVNKEFYSKTKRAGSKGYLEKIEGFIELIITKISQKNNSFLTVPTKLRMILTETKNLFNYVISLLLSSINSRFSTKSYIPEITKYNRVVLLNTTIELFNKTAEIKDVKSRSTLIEKLISQNIN